MLKKKYWKEFKKLGISKNFVSEQACGIWFKNMGCQLATNPNKTKKLVMLNTKIQAEKKE